MEIEVWKKYDERYEVSSFGNVRNEKKVLKQYLSKGYYQCSIHRKTKQVHQLVAVCFLNHTPCGLKIVVDHIDNNKSNNHKNNLQLISNRENLSKDKKTDFTGVSKSGEKFIARIYFKGREVRLGIFKTRKEASEQYNKALQSINEETFTPKQLRIKSNKFKGVYCNKSSNKWIAIYKSKYLGCFSTELEALEYYLNAVKSIENGTEIIRKLKRS